MWCYSDQTSQQQSEVHTWLEVHTRGWSSTAATWKGKFTRGSEGEPKELSVLLIHLIWPEAETKQQIQNRRCGNRVVLTAQNPSRAASGTILCREAKAMGQDCACSKLGANSCLDKCSTDIQTTGSAQNMSREPPDLMASRSKTPPVAHQMLFCTVWQRL